MTKAHSMEIARYNSTRGFWDGYCYFDSVVDFAPNSLASDEVRRLADELIDCTKREYTGVAYLSAPG
ncbi:hypothetical protein D3C73_1660760 [compost metagenome]